MMTVLVSVATATLAAAGIAGAIAVLAKSKYFGKPIKWLWRTNVSGPIGKWHGSIVGHVVDERIEHLMHHRNGGSSLLDLAEAVKVVKKDVSLLLRHDAERDTEGHRYGPTTTTDEQEN
jgi:hypothetical protein